MRRFFVYFSVKRIKKEYCDNIFLKKLCFVQCSVLSIKLFSMWDTKLASCKKCWIRAGGARSQSFKMQIGS